MKPESLKEPLELPPKPPKELLKAIEETFWNKDQMEEMENITVEYLGEFFNEKIKADETFCITSELVGNEGH